MRRWFKRDKNKKKKTEEEVVEPRAEAGRAGPALDDDDDDFIIEVLPDLEELDFVLEADLESPPPSTEDGPLVDVYPVELPPIEEFPEEEPPVVETAMVEEPPKEEPPVVETAIFEEPPKEEPPVVEEAVVEEPPKEEPPVVEEAVVEEPPAEEPPVEETVLVEEPPAEEPLVEQPVPIKAKAKKKKSRKAAAKPSAKKEVPVEELPAEDIPVEEVVPVEAPPAEEPPVEEAAPAEEPLVEETAPAGHEQLALFEKAPLEEEAPAEKPKKVGFFARLKERLSGTRAVLTSRVDHLLLGVKEIDEDVLEELEEILITSDLGVKTTNTLIKAISAKVARKELNEAGKLKEVLREEIRSLMSVPQAEFDTAAKPHVIMVVGVNGVGKTTTIAKLAHRYVEEGKKVMLVAADTFRAAAVEQLTIWSERVGADIIKQQTGADPSAVVFDAMAAARARNVDIVIIDTAGRLHTKVNLMEELKKIQRIADREMPGAPHEVLLVLDANTGQNAVNQAKLFNEAVKVHHLAMTKLDGTAKGGVLVAIYHDLSLPIRYVGLGEKMDDLRDFEAEAYVEALFS